jgi:hypothetical protein
MAEKKFLTYLIRTVYVPKYNYNYKEKRVNGNILIEINKEVRKGCPSSKCCKCSNKIF